MYKENLFGKEIPQSLLFSLAKFILPALLIFLWHPAYPQLKSGFSQSWSLTHTGLHLSHAVHIEKGHFELYVGPKIIITESYSFLEGPWGLQAGLIYYTCQPDRKLVSFVNADYLNTFSSLRETSGGTKRRGLLQEYTIGYGLRWNISQHFSIYNSISVGRYTEVHHLSGDQDSFRNSGFNTLFKIMVKYNLK